MKFVASIFDHPGVTAPLRIRVRKILQTVWNQDPKWDARLDVQRFPDFLHFKTELPFCQNVSIPLARFHRNTKIQSAALHTFIDASLYALSAVAYLRIEYVDKTVEVVFAKGKARVAPVKRKSIPKLDLRAAVCGAQSAQFLKEQQDLDVGNYFFWSGLVQQYSIG